ncbi:tetratricopeptide repeat protein [Streptomyces sp. NPDC048255]|uniref:tetratricopeptide repeat protein n=1 Tax=Streptomyces sp. NPDC048255 TaxID=3154713 RepID=UPI0033DCF435
MTLLARRTGLGRTTVSNALNQPVAPSARTVAEMARALRLDGKELLELRRQAEDVPDQSPEPVRPAAATESAAAVFSGPVADRPVGGGMLVGAPPLTASAFQPRSGLRERIDGARAGGGAVLTQTRPSSARVLSGMGGVGKTQLAAQYAHEAVAAGTGLVLWVPAGDTQQIIGLYSRAALRVGAAGATGKDPEQDARALLEWLSTTRCSWLVVLDDIADPTVVAPWWPPARPGVGWTLATTRLHDPRFTGGGRTRIDIDVYSPDEAVTYLTERLTGDGRADILDGRQDELAAQVGHLPLALGHAAAYMLAEQLTCGVYLGRLGNQALRLDDVLPGWADTEVYGRHVTAALLLSLTAAEQAGPPGLVEPVFRLAALLDPAGHPETLWTADTVLGFLDAGPGRTEGPRVTADEVRSALRVLHRYALITTDPRTPHREVRVHSLTARATRETTPESRRALLAVTAAGALAEVWPRPDHVQRDLAEALRANTAVLRRNAESHLWQGGAHDVLFLSGISLVNNGLHREAGDHWAELADHCARLIGPDHPATISARSNLAATYTAHLGRHHEALRLEEEVLADRERVLGPDHPDTVTARANLAATYTVLGRHHDAQQLQERVLADRQRLLGPDHPDTIRARANRASSYGHLGRHHDALRLQEQVLADRDRLLGSDHPDTVLARANLAGTYALLGRFQDAVRLMEQVLSDRERLLGPDHPDTIRARGSIAFTYGHLGRHHESLRLQEQVLADFERILGSDHPNSHLARANLAVAYNDLGRHHEALRLDEKVLAARERVLGPDHPDTVTARANLAATYALLGRHPEALRLDEEVLAARERVLGPDHPDTVFARANLAATYTHLGRHHEALQLSVQVLASRERLLGTDHPDTIHARSNLAATCSASGLHHDACRLTEQVLADRERVLGPDHPDTVFARANLASAYAHLGRHNDALRLKQQVLADRERVLGPDHPDTVLTRANLAAFRRQGG